jgi:hypothetical protein
VKKLEIPRRMTQFDLEELMSTWAQSEDAQVRPMGRLVREYKTSGENLHWHITGLKKGMGTVEVTYLPSSGTLTVLVHDNRRGIWAGQAYERLAKRIQKRLASRGP